MILHVEVTAEDIENAETGRGAIERVLNRQFPVSTPDWYYEGVWYCFQSEVHLIHGGKRRKGVLPSLVTRWIQEFRPNDEESALTLFSFDLWVVMPKGWRKPNG